MSKCVNKVILVGNVGQEIELKNMNNTGEAVINFGVATTVTWNVENGEKKELTQWHTIVAFRKLAEIIHQYAKKGDKVYVCGELRYREYTNKDGQKKKVAEIIASEFQILSNKQETRPTQIQFENHTKINKDEDAYDDIPF